MTFEIPESDYGTFEPLRDGIERSASGTWQVQIEKLEELTEGNENLKELLIDMIDQCFRYTKSVLEQLETLNTEGPGEEHAIKDKERSITHTATQDTIRIFARNLIKSGKKAEEIYPLLPNPDSRAACGQFALRLTLSRAAKLSD